MASTQQLFDQAVAFVRTGPKPKTAPSNQEKLQLYGLYKQATEGDCQGARPGFFQIEATAKFNAWHALRGMPRESAMLSYVAAVQRQRAR